MPIESRIRFSANGRRFKPKGLPARNARRLLLKIGGRKSRQAATKGCLLPDADFLFYAVGSG